MFTFSNQKILNKKNIEPQLNDNNNITEEHKSQLTIVVENFTHNNMVPFLEIPQNKMFTSMPINLF